MAKLLFFSTAAPEGGHYRSMATIGAAMQRRGHKVWIVSGSGPGIRLAQDLGIKTILLPSKPYKSIEFNWRDYNYLRKLILTLKPDIANTFANGIPALIFASRNTSTSVTATICGGPPRRIIPYITPIIVFSDELKENMAMLGIPKSEVHVIPGRIHLEVPSVDSEVNAFLRRIGLGPASGPFVFMICRADVPKCRAVQNFFLAAELYANRGGQGTFIHIGKGKDTSFVGMLQELAHEVNQRSGRKVLISTEEGSDAPVKFLHLADVVVGMGRSAFEGMMLAKPTVVLSNEGYGGIVNQTNVPLLAQYNFTSRGIPQPVDAEVQSSLATDILELTQSPPDREQLACFGEQWCRANLDVECAAERYELLFHLMMSKSKPPIRWSNLVLNIGYETLRSIMYRPIQMLYSSRMRGALK